jgi:hypothetical protein
MSVRGAIVSPSAGRSRPTAANSVTAGLKALAYE